MNNQKNEYNIVVGKEIVNLQDVVPVIKLSNIWKQTQKYLSDIALSYPMLIRKEDNAEKQLLDLLSLSSQNIDYLAQSMNGEWIELDIYRIYKDVKDSISEIIGDNSEYSQNIIILSEIMNKKEWEMRFLEWSTSIEGWYKSINQDILDFLNRDDIKVKKDNKGNIIFDPTPDNIWNFDIYNTYDYQWLSYVLEELIKLEIIDIQSLWQEWVLRITLKTQFEKKYPYHLIKPYIANRNNLTKIKDYTSDLWKPLEDKYWKNLYQKEIEKQNSSKENEKIEQSKNISYREKIKNKVKTTLILE